MYAEKLNIYYGVCSRQVTVMVAVPNRCAVIVVTDANNKQLYKIAVCYGERVGRQKLPAYLNKIVTNVINLFMWREAGQDDDKHWKISVIVMYVDADIFQRVGHTDIIWCSMLGADSWVYCIIS